MTNIVSVSDSASPVMRRESGKVGNRPSLQSVTHYIDVNIDFDNAGDNILVVDSAAVRAKIMNVLGVILGEEPFEPTFGSLLPFRLFNPVNEDTAFRLEADVIGALMTQMASEITVYHGACRVAELPNGDGYSITVTYSPKNSRTVDTFAYRVMRRSQQV